MTKKRALVWLRRDLRLDDHASLAHASTVAEEVACVFVFDEKTLRKSDPDDRRVGFIAESLRELDEELRARGSTLIVRRGDPAEELAKLARALGATEVCAGREYEPAAKTRDARVARALRAAGAELTLLKEHVIFDGDEVRTGGGGAYKVFTPYKNAWLRRLRAHDYDERHAEPSAFVPLAGLAEENLGLVRATEGFAPAPLHTKPGARAAHAALKAFRRHVNDYENARNYPARPGTSGLSVHLRYGTISVRACVREALKLEGRGAATWLGELIWRDFYQMVLDHYPHVARRAFRPEYDALAWPGREKHFEAWCEGRTGYPLVDAAMRQLNETGWMHNRLRMVVASFLTKDLLVDYRKGEAYFARHLLDYDLASNNGGWQWSASTGCDAQPYFRVFNPYSQSERFDPQGEFIRRMIPELRDIKGKAIHRPNVSELAPGAYPAPIVAHDSQRDRAIAMFKERRADGQEAKQKRDQAPPHGRARPGPKPRDARA